MNVCIIHMNGFLSRPHFTQVQRCQLKKTESGRSPVNLLSKPHIKLHLFSQRISLSIQHKSQGIKYPKHSSPKCQKSAKRWLENVLFMHLAFLSLSNGGAIGALASPLTTPTHTSMLTSFFSLWIFKEKERELQLLIYSHSKKPVLRSVISMATK